jgi:hypothetical protein
VDKSRELLIHNPYTENKDSANSISTALDVIQLIVLYEYYSLIHRFGASLLIQQYITKLNIINR